MWQMGVTMKEDKSQNDVLDEISISLAKQIKEQYEQELFEEKVNAISGKSKVRKRIPKWLKISGSIFLIFLAVGLGGLFWLNSLYGNINFKNDTQVKQQAEYFEQDTNTGDIKDEVNPNDVVWGNKTNTATKEKDIINILMVGEEAINDGIRGRTDSIMIATVDSKTNKLKLTSIMRDLYVQIPGYSDNKINAAYHNGGMPLLMDTLKKNFNLEVDGYVLVNFDSFESVIDELGGVEVTLSDTEARYLNRTNYISNPSNRRVHAGTQTLNGNQALGYARVRYVPNGDQANDFGRTSRQRKVLNAIFEKYKSKSALELVTMLPKLFSMVTTDITKSEFTDYIYQVVKINASKLDTFRIPIDGAFKTTRIRGMSVLLPTDLQKNADALHSFIFDEDTNNKISTQK
jgi:cell envelope-related function transcriptional attenuator common domain